MADSEIANTPALENAPEGEGGAGEPEQVKTFVIYIKFFNDQLFQIQASYEDCVADIKQYLFEAKDICHITSYNLKFNDKILVDAMLLSEIEGLQPESRLEMVPEDYVDQTARLHVRRLHDLMTFWGFMDTPTVLSRLTLQDSELSSDHQKSEQAPNVSGGGDSNNKKKRKKKGQKAISQPSPAPQQSKAAPAAENGAAPQDNQQQKYLKTFQNDVVTGNLPNFLRMSLILPPEQKKPRCVHSICMSGWNPPLGNRLCQGDLFYLEIRTLENKLYHVTASTSGFYVNQSTVSDFDPHPHPSKAYHSHELVDLLSQISPKFVSTWKELLAFHFDQHPFEVLQVPFTGVNSPWLGEIPKPQYDPNRAEEFLVIQADSDSMRAQQRDWNLEYATCRSLPKETVQQRIARDRALMKLNLDFVNSAVVGAVHIVGKSVPPINPLDPPGAHLYLFNNIFFSHTTAESNLMLDSDDVAYKLANVDLIGVRTLNTLDIDGLRTVLQCVITYQGTRLVAQSIIPGILQVDSITQTIRYGSLDGGKTLKESEPEFHELFQQAAKHLFLKEHRVEGENGVQTNVYTNLETKGIKGSDGGNYVLDTRITPQDLNFPTLRNAKLRPELLTIYDDYLRNKQQEQIVHDYYAEEKKRIDAEDAERREASGGAPLLPEEREALVKRRQEEVTAMAEKARELVLKANSEFVPKTFNLNLDEVVKSFKVVGEEAELEKDRQELKELAAFLSESVVPALVLSLLKVTSDGTPISTALHNNGINLRYLGRVAKNGAIDATSKIACVVEMIARGAKHEFFRFFQKVAHKDQSAAIAQFLNCLLAIEPLAPSKGQSKANSLRPAYGIGPVELWDNIQTQVQQRFEFNLQQDNYPRPLNPIPLLRLFCQKAGIAVVSRDYDFENPQTFTVDDIVNTFPLVKHCLPATIDGQELLDAGRNFAGQGRLDLAFELITEALAIYHQTFGPMHQNTGLCYGHLASVLFQAGDLRQAIVYQRKAIIIHERVLGLDSPEVANGYGSLGLFYQEAGQPGQAAIYLARALLLAYLSGSLNSAGNITIFNALALSAQDLKQNETALAYRRTGLRLCEIFFGENSPAVAEACHGVALCFSALDDYSQALAFERRCYEIYKSTVGESDPRTMETNIWLKQFTARAVQNAKKAQQDTIAKLSQQKIEQAKSVNHGRWGAVPSVLQPSSSSSVEPTPSDLSSLPIADLVEYIKGSNSSGRLGRKGGDLLRSGRRGAGPSGADKGEGSSSSSVAGSSKGGNPFLGGGIVGAGGRGLRGMKGGLAGVSSVAASAEANGKRKGKK